MKYYETSFDDYLKSNNFSLKLGFKDKILLLKIVTFFNCFARNVSTIFFNSILTKKTILQRYLMNKQFICNQ